MSQYLNELNAVQRMAVTTTDGPVLVVAGPGSGKTRVLTYRIAYILESGAAPWSVLALTFTNKAAREMKERITKVIGEKGNQVWAGTFHSIFARILRVEAERIGYPSNFTIYDSDDSKSLIGTIIKEMNLDKTTYNANAILSRISSAKSNLIPPKLYQENAELMQQDVESRRPQLHKIYEEYAKRCKRAGAMDFDDLLYQFFILLHQQPEVRQKYQQKFRYVLVDEFQDTNYLQYSILKKLVFYEGSPRNLCVVGDDAQSIYAFRGATIENILDFEKDFQGLKTFKLEQNYRSTHHIVQAANEVITHNRKQIKKEIWTDKTGGSRIKLIKAMTDAEEAKRVADTIQEHKNRNHLRNEEIAILYRTNAQSRGFEEALRRYNIPYRVYGGLSFYQRKEVKDLIAYLRLAVNSKDEEALRRVINYPRRGIGDATVEKLSALASREGKAIWEILPQYEGTAREKNAISIFVTLVRQLNERAAKQTAYQVANFAYKESGLAEELRGDTTMEGMGRLENTTALLDAINAFVENDEIIDEATLPEKTLANYLQNIALLTDADNNSKSTDVVTLMSVHAAKGLEYKSVFVTGLEEKLFPSFMSMDTAEGLDEERRLFYVAITRAETFLTLTYSVSRYNYGQMRYNQPSRFLEEISAEHLESANVVPRKQEPEKARVTGSFTRPVSKQNQALMADPKTFQPSSYDQIKVGMKVLHLKFGEGKVLSIDGAADNKVATIHFQEIDEPQRKIMLKFAKLQILE